MGIIRKSVITACATVALVALADFLFVLGYSEPNKFRDADAIVVLSGDYLPTGEIGPQTVARVERGVQLWRDEIAPKLVMSGGTFAGDKKIAAVLMADMAILSGVPEEAIVLEAASHSTLQNALFTANTVNTQGPISVVLVTQRYHLPRSKASFWWAGFSDIQIAAADPIDALIGRDILKEGIKAPVNMVRAIAATIAGRIGVSSKAYDWLLQ